MITLPPTSNNPDQYVLVETDVGIHVLSGWGGTYLYGACWRFSTPIHSVSYNDSKMRVVKTRSGSEYTLFKDESCYSLTSLTTNIYEKFKAEADEQGMKFSVVPFHSIDETFERLR